MREQTLIQIVRERPELFEYACYLVAVNLSDPDTEPLSYQEWKEAGDHAA